MLKVYWMFRIVWLSWLLIFKDCELVWKLCWVIIRLISLVVRFMFVCFSVDELILLNVLVVVLLVSVLFDKIFFFYWVLFFCVRFCLFEKCISVICIIGFDVLFENVVCIRLLGLILMLVRWLIGKLFCFSDVILNVEVNCVGLFGVVLFGLRLKFIEICCVGFELFVRIVLLRVLVWIFRFDCVMLLGDLILENFLFWLKISFVVVILLFVFVLVLLIVVVGFEFVLFEFIILIRVLFIVVIMYYLLLVFIVLFLIK